MVIMTSCFSHCCPTAWPPSWSPTPPRCTPWPSSPPSPGRTAPPRSYPSCSPTRRTSAAGHTGEQPIRGQLPVSGSVELLSAIQRQYPGHVITLNHSQAGGESQPGHRAGRRHSLGAVHHHADHHQAGGAPGQQGRPCQLDPGAGAALLA